MGVYENLGLRPIINLKPFCTRLGGPIMEKEVLEAMVAASRESVPMDQLQAAASRIIAEITGAEAGYVTAGAASSLTLATAACITGLDVRRMELLPDTSGIPNEVIIAREQRSGYDHAIRAAGAKLIEVGMNEIVAGCGVRATEAWEFEAAITEKTAAIAYFYQRGSSPPLTEVIGIGKRHDVPVIVDAAAQLPPVDNLGKFISMGADLVAYSGGKAICGPQSAGILCGRHDLVSAVALQHLDFDEHFATWTPPPSLISKEKIMGMPHHGIGRGFKVAKEEIVALLTALSRFTRDNCLRKAQYCQTLLKSIESELQGILNVKTEINNPPDKEQAPVLSIRVDEKQFGLNAFEISLKLKNGNPPIYVGEELLSQGVLRVQAQNLDENGAKIAAKRLREVLGNP